MRATLATSTDPEVLVPGSLEALHTDADLLDRQASDLEDAARQVRRAEVPGWIGAAAAGWDDRRPLFAEALAAAASIYRAAGEVLRAHAENLTWARTQAQVAVDLWAEGRAEVGLHGELAVALSGRRSHSTGVFGASAPRGPNLMGSTAVAERGLAKQQEAQALLATARADVDASGGSTATVLDALSEGMPDGQWHTSEFLSGLGIWLTGVVMLLARFNSLRLTADPDGYLADANAIGQGIQQQVSAASTNPHDINRVFFDSQTFHDHPGQWWGQMAPDIALTAAGGLGAGSRSLSTLATRLRAVNWADDAGVLDLAAFLRREPINLSDGSTLAPASVAEEAAAAARVQGMPEGPVKASAEAAEYQTSVYGPSERLVRLPDRSFANVDGFSTAYGLVPGDAKLVLSTRSSIYIPESINGSFSQVAIRRMDAVLLRLDEVSSALGGTRAVEIVTNNLESAHAWEARMRALDIAGYARIQP